MTARPQGGAVVGGVASIAQTTSQTTVQQASQRAAIDWRSFDVGSQHAVQFNQPNSSAVVLNRVTGPDPSQIAGQIRANGQVIISNQSGVVFHQGAVVDTAGLLVTASGIKPQSFMAGSMAFDQAPKPDAAVTNAGTITVREAGLAALVAPRVANSGVINARMGRVVLAGAETHTVDLYGDGLLAIDVTGQVRQAPRGADGKAVTALVTNTGTVVADGGSVSITAAAADGIVQNLVQAGGTIRANAAGGKAGTVSIAGVGGSVVIEGRVSADGGGTVNAAASGTVTVAGGAYVSANGRRGGGTVNIGDRATGGATVEAGARVAANGRGTGSGGRVNVLSAGTTKLAGRIEARGGSAGGDGGPVEVSGGRLELTGTIDTAAPAGKPGAVLFDPGSTAISDHGAVDYPDVDTVITPTFLQGISGPATVTATNDIYVLSSVTRLGGLQDTTLNAGNLIYVDTGVAVRVGGFFNLNTTNANAAGMTLLGTLTARTQGLTLSTTGAVIQGPNGSISTNSITGTVGSLSLTSPLNSIDTLGFSNGFSNRPLTATAANGDISVTSSTPISLQTGYFAAGTIVPNGRAIVITADQITIPAGLGNTNLSAPNGSVTLQPLTVGKAIDLSGPVTGSTALRVDPVSLQRLNTATVQLGGSGTGDINVAQDGVAINLATAAYPLSTLRLRGTGNITQGAALTLGPRPTSGTIIALDASGAAITLNNGGNSIPIVSGLVGTGDVALEAGNALTVNGAISAGGLVNLSTLGTVGTGVATMTLNASISAGTTVRLDTSNGASLATSGTVLQNAGTISGTSLIGSAQAVTLLNANNIALGTYSTSGDFAFQGAAGVQVVGVLDVGGTLALTTPGAVTQTDASSITAARFTSVGSPSASGTGSATLDSPNNVILSVGDFYAGNGGLRLTTQTPNGGSLLIAGEVRTPAVVQTAFTADRVTVRPGSVIQSGGSVAFIPLTPARPVELVGTAAQQTTGRLSLTQADVNTISATTLQLGGTDAGPIILGAASNAIDLTGRATFLNVVSAQDVSQGAGATLTVPILRGFAESLSLPNANNVSQLNSITATNGPITFNNAVSLSVTGLLQATGNVQLSAGTATTPGVPSNLTLTGDIVAPSLSLNATGAITQPSGSILVTSLSGTADTATLGQAANRVTNLGPFTATTSFTLTDGRSLAITGAIDPPDLTFNITGELAIGSSVVGGTVTFNVTGAVTETTGGSLTAATVQGAVGSLVLQQAVKVDALDGLLSGGVLTLFDRAALTVTGPVSAAGALSLTSTGPLTVAGDITAPTVTLTALIPTVFVDVAIGFPRTTAIIQTAGTVTGATQVTLTSAGRIDQTGGTIATPLLTGSAAGFASLASAANRIDVVGPFSSVGGFTLRDNQALATAGTISDTVRIGLNVAGALSVGGTLAAPAVDLVATGAITEPAGGAIQTTTLTGNAGSASLSSAGNAVTNLGAFATAGDFLLGTPSSLNVVGAVGVGAGRTLTLNPGGLVIQAGGSLTAAGGTVALAPFVAGSAFNLSSFVPTGTTNAVTADTLQVGNATTGNITVSTPFALPNVNTLALVSSGAITESAGAGITVARLTANGGSVRLDQGNAIGTLGSSAAANGFALTTTGALTVGGTVSAGAGGIALSTGNLTLGTATLAGTLSSPTGPVVLTSTGNITELNGSIVTPRLSGSAVGAQLGGANQVTGLAGFATTGLGGGFSLNTGTALAVTGAVTGNAGGSTVSLAASGALTLTAGLSASTVNLRAASIDQTAGTNAINGLNVTTTAGDAVLLGSIASIGTAQVPGTLRIVNPATQGLAVFNATAGTIDLTAADIALFGAVNTRTLRVNAANLTQFSGALGLGTLSGRVAGGVLLGPSGVSGAGTTASVETLTDLLAGGAVRLVDAAPLTLTGTNQAASFRITAPGITLAGGSIAAGSVVLEALAGGTVTLTGITQTGTTTVRPLTGTSLTLVLQVHGGVVRLNDLAAPGAGLRLGLDAGSASGTLSALSLFVDGQGGGATLLGTVGGLTEFAAAQASGIVQFDTAYTLNGCAIAAVACEAPPPPPGPPSSPDRPEPPKPPGLPAVRFVLPSTLRPDIVLVEGLLKPDLFTADLITLDIVRNPSDPDFVLPNISDRDY